VLSIDRANKTVTVRDLLNQRDYTESYDKLLLSPGASPIVPPLPGLTGRRLRAAQHPELDDIVAWIKTHHPKNAVVVGGGFIGLEVAENLVELGLKVIWWKCSTRSWHRLTSNWLPKCTSTWKCTASTSTWAMG
jgi:NADPH-dependent 2,4-dienoyl-CoA reductase/sulfur reductase-like enzyme